jgi:TolA-binding protein
MSLVTITEAAELVDKSTQTLYRHIRSGKLSRGSDGLIQTAELIRVYGELKQVENNNVVSNDNLIQHSDINVITLLQQQVDKLERDLQALKTEGLERERQAIEREKRLMALLENQSGKKDSGSLFNRFFK